MSGIKKPQIVFAVCGIKNSGKTTMVIELVKRLTIRGFKVATIKHDGHEFESDVKGTDTDRHKKAGAYGTAIMSGTKFQVVKEVEAPDEVQLMGLFPEADIIILEGFKYSQYKKIEVIRSGISETMVCSRESTMAVATNLSEDKVHRLVKENDLHAAGVKVVKLNDYNALVELVLERQPGYTNQ